MSLCLSQSNFSYPLSNCQFFIHDSSSPIVSHWRRYSDQILNTILNNMQMNVFVLCSGLAYSIFNGFFFGRDSTRSQFVDSLLY